MSGAEVRTATKETQPMSNKPLASQPINVTATTDDESVISPLSNVLPKTATRDEVDIHWLFNWSEGELSPSPTYTIYDQALLGRRVSGSVGASPQEPDAAQCKAASRSSTIRRALERLSPVHMSALARWSASPARFPEHVRDLFGRLSAVAGLTEAYEEIGGGAAFVEACRRAAGKRVKDDGTANFLRHAARVKLDVVREQAEALLREAFAAYAAARAAIAAEQENAASRRQAKRAPKLAAVVARSTVEEAKPGALARLRAKRAR